MARRQKFEYRNPDGTFKILKVVERLPDGTRIFEDGSRAAPSMARMPDGSYKKLIDMSEEEYKAWNDRIMERLGRGMSEFYANNPEIAKARGLC